MSIESEAASVPSHVPADLVIDWDFHNDPGLSVDVHKRLREVRDASPPLAWSVRHGGHWVVFGRKQLNQVLENPTVFSSRQVVVNPTAEEQQMLVTIPLQLDPPEHTAYRQVLMKHLGPKQVREMEDFVRDWAERLIQPLADSTSCDFVKDVAEPMPVSVFMETMGLDLNRFSEFHELAVRVAGPATSLEERRALLMKIAGEIAQLIEDRRRTPRNDLMSKLVAEEMNARKLSQEELFRMGILLFTAGLDTVTNAMGFGMRYVAQHRELQDQMRADPSIIPRIAEELLCRFTFVAPCRLAVQDAEVDGVTIKEGDVLACVLWGGSNDDSREAAEVHGRQYVFGRGAHICLGMYLARLELRIMYETWFKHIDRFGVDPQKPAAMNGGGVMGISSLPLVLEPLSKPAAT